MKEIILEAESKKNSLLYVKVVYFFILAEEEFKKRII